MTLPDFGEMRGMSEYNLYPDKDQAARLGAGLAKMQEEFLGRLCPLCDGVGQYKQTYTAGCGMGYYRSDGPCDYCKGWGLLVGTTAATKSVINQVYEATNGPRP